MTKIKVAAISYLNTKPLLYGMQPTGMLDSIELVLAHPAQIATMLLNKHVDMGLIPVATLAQMQTYYIVSNYCIGAEGEVASVCLFSDVPLEDIETILLDYQSKTSINLAKILVKLFWKLDVVFESATPDYINKINGTTAGVIIGDRALQQKKNYTYIYDLATAWEQMTDLPFVFAAWIANKKMPDNFIKKFDNANAYGLARINQVVAENPCTYYDLHKYYTDNISFDLTKNKKKGMALFLQLINELA